MNLTEQTPAEIDNALATALAAIGAHRTRADAARTRVEWIDAADDFERDHMRWASPESRAEAVAAVEAAEAEITRIHAEQVEPRNTEFTRRGGWTRYYLVTNAGGHVHSSTTCPTCYPSTTYAWLTEQSGMTPEALVDMAGEKACTVCFPWAPVDTLTRPSRLEAPERKAARHAREAAKAEREAKRAAKAIGPLRVYSWTSAACVVQQPDGTQRYYPERDHYDTIATVHAAKAWLTNHYAYDGHGSRPDDVRMVAEALAAKEGKAAEQVLAEAEKRAARRR